MNWRRRSYSFDGLSSLGRNYEAQAVALIGIGFTPKLAWKLITLGWELI